VYLAELVSFRQLAQTNVPSAQKIKAQKWIMATTLAVAGIVTNFFILKSENPTFVFPQNTFGTQIPGMPAAAFLSPSRLR